MHPVICKRDHVLCYLHLFADSGVQHVLTICVTWRLSYKNQELLTVRMHMSSCVFSFLRPVSFMHNATSVSGLSIPDYPFGFL